MPTLQQLVSSRQSSVDGDALDVGGHDIAEPIAEGPGAGAIVLYRPAVPRSMSFAQGVEKLQELLRSEEPAIWSTGLVLTGALMKRDGGLPKSAAALSDVSMHCIADELWGNTRIISQSAAAKQVNKDQKKFALSKDRYCGMAYFATQRMAMDMVLTMSQRCERHGIHMQCFFEGLRFDETPLWLRANAIPDDDVGIDSLAVVPAVAGLSRCAAISVKAPHKLTQFEWTGNMLLRQSIDKYLLVSFKLPMALRVSDRCVGETYAEMIRTSRPNGISDISKLFSRWHRLVCTDGDGACRRGVRGAFNSDPDSIADHTDCEVHLCSHLGTGLSDKLASFLSGARHCVLALSHGFEVSAFRKIVKELIRSRAKYFRGSPPESSTRHREALLNIMCPTPPGDKAAKLKREIVGTLANGRYDRPGTFEHFCRGCCIDEEDWLGKVMASYVPAAFGKLVIWQKKNWLGIDASLQGIGLLWATHRLFPDAFCLWMQRFGDPPRAIGGLLAIRDAPDADPPGAADNEDPDPRVAMKKRQSHHRTCARDCLDDYDSFPMLLILTCCVEPQARLMKRELKIASDAWDREQDGRMAASIAATGEGSRLFRGQIYGSGTIEVPFFVEINRLMSDVRAWCFLDSDYKTVQNRSLATRLLSCLGAQGHLKLRSQRCLGAIRVIHEAFTHMRSPEAFGRALFAVPPCLLGRWGNTFVEKFGEIGLMTTEALAEAQAAGIVYRKEQAKIEQGHASIRRRVHILSTQTHQTTVMQASNDFTLKQVRESLAISKASPTLDDGSTRGNDDDGDVEQRPQKKHRKWGACRAFFSDQMLAQGGVADFASLHARYKNLTPEQQSDFEKRGQKNSRSTVCADGSHRAPFTQKELNAIAAKDRKRVAQLRVEETQAAFAADPCADVAVSPDRPTLLIPGRKWEDHVADVRASIRAESMAEQAVRSVLDEALDDHMRTNKIPESLAIPEDTESEWDAACHHSISRLPSPVPTIDRCFWAPLGLDSILKGAISLNARKKVAKLLHQAVDGEWDRIHKTIQADTCPAIDDSEENTACRSAGMCICKGRGRFVELARLSFSRSLRNGFSGTNYDKSVLKNGWIVCRLIGRRDVEPPVLKPAEAFLPGELSCSDPVAAEVETSEHWLHLGYVCLKSYRPTFAVLRLDRLGDGRFELTSTGRYILIHHFIDTLDLNRVWEVKFFKLMNTSAVVEFLPEIIWAAPYGKG